MYYSCMPKYNSCTLFPTILSLSIGLHYSQNMGTMLKLVPPKQHTEGVHDCSIKLAGCGTHWNGNIIGLLSLKKPSDYSGIGPLFHTLLHGTGVKSLIIFKTISI